MQMWSLYVVPNFTFKFVHSTFIFSFQNFMSECFLYFFSPKFILKFCFPKFSPNFNLKFVSIFP